MKIRTKILIFILSTSFVVYGLALSVVSYNFRTEAIESAKSLTDAHAREAANLIKAKLENNLFITRTIAQSLMGFRSFTRDQQDSIYLGMYLHILEANPEFISVATSWELQAIDSTWKKPYGRSLKGYFRADNKINFFTKIQNTEGDIITGRYYQMKKTGNEMVVDPETYSYTGKDEDAVLSANFSSPVMIKGRFVGLAGIDVSLASFQSITEKIHPFPGSYAFLISNDCRYVSNPNLQKVGKSVVEENREDNLKYHFEQKIKNGANFSFFTGGNSGKDIYISFAPVNLDRINTPWSVGIVVPVDVIIETANRNFYISIITGILGLVVLAIVIWFISQNITKPLIVTTKVLNNLSQGKIDKSQKLHFSAEGEIAEMADSVNKLIDGLNRTSIFAKQIGTGNLTAEFELLGESDVLGTSLIDMRTSLKIARDEVERRRTEDEKASWATEGTAKFAEMLREHTENMHDFAYNIINHLVEYVGVNQAGMFLINDRNPNDTYIELVASFAYNRRKFIEKRIEMGVGLVGRCILESQSIYLSEIPENYLVITSGLGDSNPRYLLLAPLQFNQVVYGVIEIASFKPLEQYQIDFVERVGEMTASAILSIKVNLRTSELLQETKKYSEELAMREEEMRQNMEEMQAQQEEVSRKQQEMTIYLSAINGAIATIEYDTEGYIVAANELFLATIGYTHDELLGKQQNIFLEPHYIKSFEYEDLWSDLRRGILRVGDYVHITKEGKKICLNTGYAPAFDANGHLVKIVQYSNDITRVMENILAWQTQVDGANKFICSIQYDIKGIVIDVNSTLLETLSYQRSEMIGRPQSLFLSDRFRQSKNYLETWKSLSKGERLVQELEFIDHNGQQQTFECHYYPITDFNGVPRKILSYMKLV